MKNMSLGPEEIYRRNNYVIPIDQSERSLVTISSSHSSPHNSLDVLFRQKRRAEGEIISAAADGREQRVRELLASRIISDDDIEGAIRSAALFGKRECLEVIFENRRVSCVCGNRGFQNAIRNRNYEIVSLFINKMTPTSNDSNSIEGVCPNEITRAKYTVEAINAIVENPDLVGKQDGLFIKKLLESVPIDPSSLFPAIRMSAAKGFDSYIHLFLPFSNISDTERERCIQIATQSGHPECAKALHKPSLFDRCWSWLSPTNEENVFTSIVTAVTTRVGSLFRWRNQ